MNITSNNIMIFAKEFNGRMYYRAGMSTKDKDGKYINAYIDVKLPKGDSLPDKTRINITKGFLSFYKNKEGKEIWYIVVQEYEKIEFKEEKKTDVYENFGNKVELTPDDLDLPLPF